MAFSSMQFPVPQENEGGYFENTARQYKGLIEPYMANLRMKQGDFKNQILGAEAKYAPLNEAEKYAQAQSKTFIDDLEKQYKEREILANLQYKHAMALNQERMASGIGLSKSGSIEGNSEKERRIRFNALGADGKAEILSHAAPLDLDPLSLQHKLIVEGKSLPEIYKEQNKVMGEISKSHLPTSSNRTQQKNQDAGAAELDSLEEFSSVAMAPYSRKFFGYSPVQIGEALSGQNEEEQAMYLAGRALQPEIAAARSRIAGGSNAQQALQHAQESALGSSKVFESLVSPSVFLKTQEIIRKELKKALGARRSVIYNETQTDKKIDAINKAEKPTDEDIEFMAKEHNMTTDEVKQYLRQMGI